MINRQFSTQLSAQPHFAREALGIGQALDKRGKVSSPTQHHNFIMGVSEDDKVSEEISGIEVSIIDTPKTGGCTQSFLDISALGHESDKPTWGKSVHTKQVILADGSSVWIPVLGSLLVDLRSCPDGDGGTRTFLSGFSGQNYAGAKKAHIFQNRVGENFATNPLYRLMAKSCDMPRKTPVETMTDQLRLFSLYNGHSTLRQYGRLELPGWHHNIQYSSTRPLRYAPNGEPYVTPFREEFSTTTFERKRRLDTTLFIDTLVDIDGVQQKGGIRQLNAGRIAAKRSVITLGSGKEEQEIPQTSREAISFIAPMIALAHAALGRRPIHLDRQKAA
ncbi:MAG: hypothetical protein WBP26_06255 [Candidatus Saccharimonadales bacterium]